MVIHIVAKRKLVVDVAYFQRGQKNRAVELNRDLVGADVGDLKIVASA